MPIYNYNCHKCGEKHDVWAKIEEQLKTCPDCGLPMIRLFSPPTNIITDIEPYFDDNIGSGGSWVTSRQHKRALMKQEGLVHRR